MEGVAIGVGDVVPVAKQCRPHSRARSDPTHSAKGRTGGCPGPRKETNEGRDVTHGGAMKFPPTQSWQLDPPPASLAGLGV